MNSDQPNDEADPPSDSKTEGHQLTTRLEALIAQFETTRGGFSAPPLIGGFIDDIIERFPDVDSIKAFVRTLVGTVATNETRIDAVERSLQELRDDVADLREDVEETNRLERETSSIQDQLVSLETRVENVEHRLDQEV